MDFLDTYRWGSGGKWRMNECGKLKCDPTPACLVRRTTCGQVKHVYCLQFQFSSISLFCGLLLYFILFLVLYIVKLYLCSAVDMHSDDFSIFLHLAIIGTSFIFTPLFVVDVERPMCHVPCEMNKLRVPMMNVSATILFVKTNETF